MFRDFGTGLRQRPRKFSGVHGDFTHFQEAGREAQGMFSTTLRKKEQTVR